MKYKVYSNSNTATFTTLKWRLILCKSKTQNHLELVVYTLEINTRCTLDLNFVPANKQYQPVLSYGFKETTLIYTYAKVRKMFLVQTDDHRNNFAKLTLRSRRGSLIKTLAFHFNEMHFYDVVEEENTLTPRY